MASRTTSVKIMVISDIHGASSLPGQAELPRVDMLLHCGDLTSRGRLPGYENTLSLLGSIDAKLKLVIAGNHDVTLDAEYWRAHGPAIVGSDYSSSTAPAAIKLMKGPKTMQAGVMFLHEGMHSFRL
jgi:predicted phosphodiesterase